MLARLRSPALDAVRDVPGVWVVGGAVRDVLLGREPRELDLLVEGDAGAVARRLGQPDGRPRALRHLHGRRRRTSATTRREIYARAGALPEVALGATVEEDLARRDFTVNALAVRLADGHGVAWPGALEDLEAGVLRVLHEHSFEDDPTRLLRMARYAARLGFAPEPATDALAAAAMADGGLATVSGSRIGAEVRLALARAARGARRRSSAMASRSAAIHPAYSADPALLAAVVERRRRARWPGWRCSAPACSTPTGVRAGARHARLPGRGASDRRRRRRRARALAARSAPREHAVRGGRRRGRASPPRRWRSPQRSAPRTACGAGWTSGGTCARRSPARTCSTPACRAPPSAPACARRWRPRSTAGADREAQLAAALEARRR